jgi:hypothetical protein
MTEQTETAELSLKLVVTTMIWANSATEEMPLWKTVGGKEYIVARFDHEPSLDEIGRACENKRHLIETHTKQFHETLSGWQLYLDQNITHNEYLQYSLTEQVEFPAIDLTEIDASEELRQIVGE